MTSKPDLTDDKEQNEVRNERRGFLKKAVYAAPTLIVLGELVKPESAKSDFGGPPSDPGW